MIRCEHYLAGSFRRGSEVWPVFSLRTLVESQAVPAGFGVNAKGDKDPEHGEFA